MYLNRHPDMHHKSQTFAPTLVRPARATLTTGAAHD